MDPAGIDLAFVPTRRSGLVTVGRGADQIVLDEVTDRLHVLSPTATLVWSFIDGQASIEDFAVDLVAVLDLDPPTVRAELLDLVHDLGRRALLEGFDPPLDRGLVADQVDRVEGAARHLAAPASPALDERFEPSSSRVVSIRAAELTFDVRVDDAALADDLHAELLAGLHIASTAPRVEVDLPRPLPTGPRPLYSVLRGRGAGPTTGLHFLYRSARPLRRTRERADLLRIAVADVLTLIEREAGGRALLDAVGLVRDGVTVIVDPIFSAFLDDMDRDFRRRGIDRLDASFVDASILEGRHLGGIVLRPREVAATASPADVAAGAADLCRGVERRIDAGALGLLLDLVTIAPVTRVPGRAGLRTEILRLIDQPDAPGAATTDR